MQRIAVVGMGADGWEGLGMESRRLVREAEVVMGGKRHLDTVPWAWWQLRVEWPSQVVEALPGLLEAHADKRIVVIASGDPLTVGIAGPLVALLGADAVDVVPAVSSETLARARMRWTSEETSLVSLVNGDVRALVPHLAPGRRLVVLSADGGTPASVAALLVAQGYGDSEMTVLSDLGGLAESRLDATAGTWTDRVAAELNVVCLSCVADASRRSATSSVPGLPDDAFGDLTTVVPRDVRTATLARLAPAAGDLLWASGSGAASVAIEWLRAEPLASAVAVVGSDDVGAAKEAAADLGAGRLRVVTDPAAARLRVVGDEEPTEDQGPDAVFVGSGADDPARIDALRSTLRVGGRLVVHATTVAEEGALHDRYLDEGGELIRLGVESASKLGGWTRRTVTQWSVTR